MAGGTLPVPPPPPASERRADVAVLEKAVFPREKVCGDGLTPRGVKALQDMGVDTAGPDWVRHRGLRVFGGGQVAEVDWPRLASWPDFGLIRARRDLDPLLAAHAAGAGGPPVPDGAVSRAPLRAARPGA